MIVKVENEDNYVLKVGDIVRICDDLGHDGFYETLEDLTESLEGEGAIIYRANEYDLVLSKKK